jgi:hypothetical protein
LPPDYRLVFLNMALEDIEQQDEATAKVIRELKAKGRLAKASRPPRKDKVS